MLVAGHLSGLPHIAGSHMHANLLMHVQSSVLAAVDEGQELMKRCMAMAKQLRGTDGLANRVRQLRHAVEALERQVDSWLR